MVRFSEGPTTSVERVIPAPAEEIWPLVSDINLSADYSDEFVGAEWLDAVDTPAVGARFVGRNRRGDTSWETVSTITDADHGRCFGWVVGDPAAAISRWRFTLEPAGDGTRVTFWVRVGPGRSGLTWRIRQEPEREEQLIEFRLAAFRRNMTAVLDGIAEQLGSH